MKKVYFIVLLFVFFMLLTNSETIAGDIVDILKEKGVITEDEAKEVKASHSTKEKHLNVLEKMSFKGDLRLRHDTQWRDTGDDDYGRNRERYRIRFGVKAKTTENTEVGFRLASGSGYQNTTNQSFDEHARGKGIFIDRAYASWKPNDTVKIIGGKHANPLLTTSLVWDSDVKPEGVSECLDFDVSDDVDIFFNLGQWIIEELDIKDTDKDPTLLAYQAGITMKPSKDVKLDIAGSFYDFINMDAMKWKSGILSDKSEFLGYNNTHSQQMVFDNQGNLLNEFRCLELVAKLKLKDLFPKPFSLFGSFIMNADADVDELIEEGADPGDSNPPDLKAYSGDDRDTGWLIGFSLGNKKKKGDWYTKYFYQELEDYAFPAVFVDSDFHGGGTNNKGHCIQGQYLLASNIHVKGTLFSTKREDESMDGQKDEDRIQLDLIFKF
ncbi:MAG: putative porin [Thermodesulfobacteriota bacterium]|nr:putative porin [Thermodesulfobacteriota bacterium]